jgi:hypothetical protein
VTKVISDDVDAHVNDYGASLGSQQTASRVNANIADEEASNVFTTDEQSLDTALGPSFAALTPAQQTSALQTLLPNSASDFGPGGELLPGTQAATNFSEFQKISSTAQDLTDAQFYPESLFDKVLGELVLTATVGAATAGFGAEVAPLVSASVGGGVGGTVATGAVEGAFAGTATSVLTGQNVAKGALGGALTGAAAAGTPALGQQIQNVTGLSAAASDALAGAGLGATKAELTGGNVEESAALGGIGGAVEGSGVTNQVKGYLEGEGASPAAASAGAGLATGAATAGVGALLGSALTSSPQGGSTVSTPADQAISSTSGAPSTFTSGLESGLGSSLGTTGTNLAAQLGSLTGNLLPYAAVGAIGQAQASKGEAEDAQYSQELQNLAKPALGESATLLNNYNTNTPTPAAQAVENTMVAQGNSTIQSASGLSAIAQAAFQQYQAGQLQPAQQAQLDQQTASEKQQVAQQLASAGITDSTILQAQYNQIDTNALITKQNMINSNFATGVQAYDQWLTSTTQGQQTIQQGMEYASSSVEQELQDSMSEAGIGIGEMNTAITTQMQTDQEYANQVSQLYGTLAAAYAKQVAGQRSGGGSTSIVNPGGGASGSGMSTAGGGALNSDGSLTTGAGGSTLQPASGTLQYDQYGDVIGSADTTTYGGGVNFGNTTGDILSGSTTDDALGDVLGGVF